MSSFDLVLIRDDPKLFFFHPTLVFKVVKYVVQLFHQFQQLKEIIKSLKCS